MNTKTIVTGLIGGVVYFFLGWLLYGILLASTFESLGGSAQGVSRGEELVMWALILGHVFMGIAMAYILVNWAKVSTVQGGAVAGATVAFLYSLGIDLTFYATSNIMQLGGVFLDVAVFTVTSAIAGAIMGWWLGRASN